VGFLFGGGGAVVAYSAVVSQPERSLSAPRNLSTVFAAHSSKLSEPLPLVSSLAKALRRGSNSSAAVMRPSSSLSARAKRFSSRDWGVASGGSGSLSGRLEALDGGGIGKAWALSALPCESSTVPMMRRRQEARAARYRATGHSRGTAIRQEKAKS